MLYPFIKFPRCPVLILFGPLNVDLAMTNSVFVYDAYPFLLLF